MNKEAEQLVNNGVQQGVTMESIRNELISNGHGTEGFDEAYKAAIAELGVQEKHEAVHEGSIYAGVELDPNRPRDMGDVIRQKESFKRRMSRKKVLGTMFGLLLICAIGFAFLSSGDDFRGFLGGVFGNETVEEMSPFDAKLAIEADRYQIAAEAYKSKIFSYDGLCKSIGLNPERFTCKENMDAYVIDTKLGTGEYYCVDNTGFKGLVNEARSGKLACRE